MTTDEILIDRLVDGELSGPDRRDLLARLDASPDGWRRCALAFLEAQAWREALAPPAAPARTVETPPAPRRRLVRARAAASLAAGLLAAYALGWASRGVRPERPAVVAPRVTAAPTRPPEGSVASAPAPEAVVPTWPEDAVKAWERDGYRVERRQRLVAVELEGGREVAVPVDDVRLRYVGDRTY